MLFRSNGASWLSTSPNAFKTKGYTYDDRNDLRSIDGATDQAVIIDGLGVFQYLAGSTETDDDETCFASPSGRWLIQAMHPDYLEAYLASQPAPPQLDTWIETFTSTIASVTLNTAVSMNLYVQNIKAGAHVIVNPPPTLTVIPGQATLFLSGVCTLNETLTIYFKCGANAVASGLNIDGYTARIINP